MFTQTQTNLLKIKQTKGTFKYQSRQHKKIVRQFWLYYVNFVLVHQYTTHISIISIDSCNCYGWNNIIKLVHRTFQFYCFKVWIGQFKVPCINFPWFFFFQKKNYALNRWKRSLSLTILDMSHYHCGLRW